MHLYILSTIVNSIPLRGFGVRQSNVLDHIVIDPVLNSVSTDTLRKYFREASEYMKANREGVTDGVIVVEALKNHIDHIAESMVTNHAFFVSGIKVY